MLKMKLSCRDQSDWVISVMKIRKDNNVFARTGVVFVENDTELS